jgi:putative NIF3 family GTP cyclohydrolase 1 type 2
VPVQVVRLRRDGDRAGRVAVVGGGGADRDALQASLERGCQTYVTGGTLTRWAAEFLTLADEAGVAVIDGTHYGTEKPPQIAMVEWFRTAGLEAEFIADGPK